MLFTKRPVYLPITFALLFACLGTGCDSAQPPSGPRGDVTAPEQAPVREAGGGPAAEPAGHGEAGTGESALTVPPAGELYIDISDTGVVILAGNVSQQVIISELATRAGFELVTADVAWEDVSLAFQAVDLHTALVELLKAHPYQIIYEYDHDFQNDALKRVVVGTPVSAAEGVAMAPRTPATVAAASYQAPTGSEEPLSEQNQAYLNLLLDPSPEVREDAAEDIEPVGIALDYLAEVVARDPSPDVRIAAAYTLQQSKDPRAFDALVRALQDNDPRVVEEVIDALWYVDNSNAVPYLQPMLNHPNSDVRSAAESAISDLQ